MLRSRKRGFTLVELLVVIFIIGFLAALLLPAMLHSRDGDDRRSYCTNQMKQLGLALHNFADARKHFPGSSSLPWKTTSTTVPKIWEAPTIGAANDWVDEENAPATYGNGFSWMTMILPYIEMGPLYQRLDTVGNWGTDPQRNRPQGPWQYIASNDNACLDRSGRSLKYVCHPLVWRMPVDAFLCPNRSSDTPAIDNSMGLYGDEISKINGLDTTPAATSYVAISATHFDSLRGAVDPSSRFEGGKRHPNGVMYPGSKTSFCSMKDGTSNTVIVCETKEPTYAAWYDGATAGVVGLTTADGDGNVTFVQAGGDDPNQAKYNNVPQSFGAPTNAFTTLNYGDGSKKFYMKGVAPFAAPTRAKGKEWRYGPSSEHPGVVLHLFGDGSVHPLSAGTSPEVYMHLITRNGGETVDLD